MNYSEELIKSASTLRLPDSGKIQGRVAWKSPSNIALVKYWGKKGGQVPANPSLSFTLSSSYTETGIEFSGNNETGRVKTEFYFEGQKNEAFGAKIEKYLESITGYLPFLGGLSLVINSRNSFPHSAGIASSASAMSSLALGLCSIENIFFGSLNNDRDFFQKASFLARLGSGSASRSVYGGYTVWGQSGIIDGSTDEYAVPYSGEIDFIFRELNDTVLIASSSEKKVSSTVGHSLMKGHPFAERRFRQANENLSGLTGALKAGDWDIFSYLVENEALTLHSMMMTSNPSFILMNPSTLSIIERIRDYRAATGVPVTFTLDAGPNVHVIYPNSDRDGIRDFLKNELSAFCEDGRMIDDFIGTGPMEIK